MTTGYILTVGAECLRDLSTTEATRVSSQTTGVYSGNNLGLTTKTMESYWCTSQAPGVINLDIVSTNNFVHKVTGADVEGINISMDDDFAGSTIPLSSCSSRSRTRIPPRYSRDERQAVEDSIRTLSGTHTSHLESKNACSEWDFSKLRSKYFPRAHWQGPCEFFAKTWNALDPVFHGISAAHGKVLGLRRPDFQKTSSPRQLMG